MKRFAFYGLIYISMYIGSIRLRQYDRELSELVEDYKMALCVVLAWASCWWLSVTSAGGRRPRGVGILVSLVSLIAVATGLYQVLQVARGMPVGLVQQVVQIVLGLLVMIFYMKERYYV